jgi:hypothetical protein
VPNKSRMGALQTGELGSLVRARGTLPGRIPEVENRIDGTND